MQQAIRRGSGGTIRFRVGRCSALESASYTVFDASGAVLQASTAIDDPYADTVSSQTQSGDLTVLAVTTPPTSLRGKRIRLITNAGPYLEQIVEAVGSADITVRLPRYGAIISAVLMPELEAPIPASICGTVGSGYRVQWSFEADGLEQTHDTRYSVVEVLTPDITWAELLDRDPALRVYLSTGGDVDWTRILEIAKEMVDTEMGRYGERSLCIAEYDQLVPLLARSVQVLAAERGFIPPRFTDPTAYLTDIRRQFTSECKAVLQTAYRQDETGSVTDRNDAKKLRTVYIRRA